MSFNSVIVVVAKFAKAVVVQHIVSRRFYYYFKLFFASIKIAFRPDSEAVKEDTPINFLYATNSLEPICSRFDSD